MLSLLAGHVGESAKLDLLSIFGPVPSGAMTNSTARPDRRRSSSLSARVVGTVAREKAVRSKSLRAQIGMLILATSIIQLANGFFGTFISLRVAIEDFGPTTSGLVLSSYFAGFT